MVQWARRPGLRMEGVRVSVKLAVAPDSWGVWFDEDPRQTPWSRFLDEAVEAGFNAIELGPFGYLPTSIPQLHQELSARELTLTGAFFMSEFQGTGNWGAIKNQVSEICDLLNAFGAEHLVLLNSLYIDMSTGERVAPSQLNGSAWQKQLETLDAIGNYTSANGITSVYHPHADSVIQYEDQIEDLLDRTDPTTVSLCLDIGHHAYAGGDPVEFMRRHHSRIPYLHLKNVDATVMSSVRENDFSFVEAVELGAFTTLDSGIVDVRALRQVIEDSGFDGWAVVEQDMFPCSFDKPLPLARRNREFLRTISLG
jgi:inosose dehydratase